MTSAATVRTAGAPSWLLLRGRVAAVRGQPAALYAEAVRDADGVDTRMAVTMRLGHDVLAQFDVGLDLPRRDELSSSEPRAGSGARPVGSAAGKRSSFTAMAAPNGCPSTPGAYVAHDGYDVHRIELDTVPGAIASGSGLPFSPADAIDQAAALHALPGPARSPRPWC